VSEGVEWGHLAYDSDSWWGPVKMIIDLLIPEVRTVSYTSGVAVSYVRRTLLRRAAFRF
jgi:hypothetical protein